MISHVSFKADETFKSDVDFEEIVIEIDFGVPEISQYLSSCLMSKRVWSKREQWKFIEVQDISMQRFDTIAASVRDSRLDQATVVIHIYSRFDCYAKFLDESGATQTIRLEFEMEGPIIDCQLKTLAGHVYVTDAELVSMSPYVLFSMQDVHGKVTPIAAMDDVPLMYSRAVLMATRFEADVR